MFRRGQGENVPIPRWLRRSLGKLRSERVAFLHRVKVKSDFLPLKAAGLNILR